MFVICGFFVVAGFVLFGWGFLMLTQATNGVGAIGMACFLGILARMAQSSGQHDEAMKARLDIIAGAGDALAPLPKDVTVQSALASQQISRRTAMVALALAVVILAGVVGTSAWEKAQQRKRQAAQDAARAAEIKAFDQRVFGK